MILFLNLLFFIANNLIVLYFLYLFQLKGYFKKRYLKFVIKNKLFIINLIFLTFYLLINLFTKKILNLIFSLILINLIIILYLILLIKKKKIKFNITFKIKRLIILYNIFNIFIFIFNFDFNLIFNYLLFADFLIVPLLDIIDVYSYFENKKFITKTKSYLLEKKHIIKIGITGSNGKTSVKNILYFILKNFYDAVTTPKNFNTPKGVTYTITKMCNEKTNCIILEFGAKQIGDIKKLCDLTKVNLGVVTSVCPQHIETFKNIKNVYKTKKELPDYLGEKFCVFNYNNYLTRRMFLEKSGEKFLVAVFKSHKSRLKKKLKIKFIKAKLSFSYKRDYKIDMYAKNVKITNGETHFLLYYKNEILKLKTKLLGEHNVQNILSALAIISYLKINLRDVINLIYEIPQVPHRLELIKTHINILDDSYNCSLISAQASLEVLAQFSGKKMICTPGIIEGGKMQMQINMKLCNLLKNSADYYIFVGKTNREIFKSNFPLTQNVYYVDNLDSAKKLFNLLNANDTLLLLNDLPDDYN